MFSNILASAMLGVKKLWKKIRKLCESFFEKIPLRMMNLSEREETILRRMRLEQETMRNASVSFIITMDNAEIEEREKLMRKIQKDQEILDRLDEVMAICNSKYKNTKFKSSKYKILDSYWTA